MTNSERQAVAENAFTNFDFGDNVKDVSGWEIAGNLWKRTVFLEQDWDKPSVKGVYYIRFCTRTNYIESEWADVAGEVMLSE